MLPKPISAGFEFTDLVDDVKTLVSVAKMSQGFRLYLGWESDFPIKKHSLLLKVSDEYTPGEEMPPATIMSHEVATALLTELWFVGLRPNGWSESVANNGFETVVAVLTSQKESLEKQLAEEKLKNIETMKTMAAMTADFAEVIAKIGAAVGPPMLLPFEGGGNEDEPVEPPVQFIFPKHAKHDKAPEDEPF